MHHSGRKVLGSGLDVSDRFLRVTFSTYFNFLNIVTYQSILYSFSSLRYKYIGGCANGDLVVVAAGDKNASLLHKSGG